MSKKLPSYNPNIPFINGVDTLLNWTGNPIHKKMYQNHEFPMSKDFSDVWRWKSKKNPYEQENLEQLIVKNIAGDNCGMC